MKIYKIAQGVPVGSVEVEITIDKQGNYHAKILRHGEGTSCLTENDDRLLKDLITKGLGNVTPVDAGHTREYFEERRKKEAPEQAEPEQAEAPYGETPIRVPEEERKLDLGFNV